MNNKPLNILWGLIILALIILTILVILFIVRWINELDVFVFEKTDNCVLNTNIIPNISDELCCYIGTAVTASKYVPSIDMVVNPVAIPYLPVCQGYCKEGVLSDGITCVDQIGQIEFNNCMNISTPIDCIGLSLPVAYAGTTAYYPHAATESSCLTKGKC